MNDKNKLSDSTVNFDNAFNQYSLEDWQSLATKSLKGAPLASLAHTSASGLALEPLYTDRPDAQIDLLPHPLQRWDNRLAVLGETPSAQNNSLLTGLHGGISSAQIYFNSPEQASPITNETFATVLQDVQLDILPVSLMAGSQFASAAKQMESIWASQGVNADSAMAAFNADPIGTLAATGGLSKTLNSLLHEMTQLAIDSMRSFPKATSVCVNSTCYHNAGASLEQELASAIATATLYMQSMLDAGMSAQAAHDTVIFQVACDADTIINVVKLRTLKMLWHHVATQLGVEQPTQNVVVETSRRMQSNREPWVNHLRNVSAATAAAMGGAQSIIVHPHNRIDDVYVDDEIEVGARVARNVAVILSEESAMTFVHDPMGGSYAVETLTNNLSNTTWQALQELERDGGLVKALTSGHWQSSIAATAQQRSERLHQELDVQVAVNRYINNVPAGTEKSTLSSEDTADQTNSQALNTVRDALTFEASS